MQLNMNALNETAKVSGVRLSKEVDEETGEEFTIQKKARLFFVSEDVLNDALRLCEENPSMAVRDSDPDVSVGDLFMLYSNDDGIKMIHTSISEAFSDPDMKEEVDRYFINDIREPGRIIPLISNFAFAREALMQNLQIEGMDEFKPDIRSALRMVQDITDEFSSQIQRNPEGFDGSLLAQVHATQIVDGNRNARFDVDMDQLQRYYQGKLLKDEIKRFAPDHPDASKSGNAFLNEIAQESGASVFSGAQIQAYTHAAMERPETAQMATAFATFTRDVFAKLTRMNVDDLEVSMISSSRGANFIEALETSSEELTGTWIDLVRGSVSSVTQNIMPGYGSELRAFIKDDVDILVVQDTVKNLRNGADLMVYSWPTETRVPTVDIENSRAVTISPEDIPSYEEIDRLKSVLVDVTPEPEMLSLEDMQ